jgi:hypothetical protein
VIEESHEKYQVSAVLLEIRVVSAFEYESLRYTASSRMTEQRIITMTTPSVLALFLLECQEYKTLNPTALQGIFSFHVSKSFVENPSNTLCKRQHLLQKQMFAWIS